MSNISERVDGIAFEVPKSGYTEILGRALMYLALVEAKIRGSMKQPCELLLFHGLSERLRDIARNATTSRALKIIYNHVPNLHGIAGWLGDLWLDIAHARAVRNRARIVHTIIHEECLRQLPSTQPQICSLASGSAEPVLAGAKGLPCDIVLIDQDEVSLAYARTLAEGMSVRTVNDTVLRCWNILQRLGFHPTIIEIVGLFDYFDDRTILFLLGGLQNRLQNPCTLVTAHIHLDAHRFDSEVLEQVIGWRGMKRRSRLEFETLITKAGWKIRKVIQEPYSIYTVITATNEH